MTLDTTSSTGLSQLAPSTHLGGDIAASICTWWLHPVLWTRQDTGLYFAHVSGKGLFEDSEEFPLPLQPPPSYALSPPVSTILPPFTCLLPSLSNLLLFPPAHPLPSCLFLPPSCLLSSVSTSSFLLFPLSSFLFLPFTLLPSPVSLSQTMSLYRPCSCWPSSGLSHSLDSQASSWGPPCSPGLWSSCAQTTLRSSCCCCARPQATQRTQEWSSEVRGRAFSFWTIWTVTGDSGITSCDAQGAISKGHQLFLGLQGAL